MSTSSNSDDKDETSNTSDGNLDGPVVSQKNEEENENNLSSDKAVSKSSSKDNDVDALSLSGQLASQVTAALTTSLIMPSTENLMAATSDKPTPNPKATKLHTTPPITKTVDKSILLPLAQQLGAILSKPVLTLATDPDFKAQLSDIFQTFSSTPHPETIDPLLARLRKIYEDLYVKFSDSQVAISSYQQSTEAFSKLKQDTSSFEIAKTTLAVHIAKVKNQAHELSEEIRDLKK
ncbi:uncharacterized protein DS421_20g705370 [Arachis hypogaea]|nr:uncharacterized protein DS421_20g705370 [Arachis hypogaea]